MPPLRPNLCEGMFYSDQNFGNEELLKVWNEFHLEEHKGFIREFGEHVDMIWIKINLNFLIELAHYWDLDI